MLSLADIQTCCVCAVLCVWALVAGVSSEAFAQRAPEEATVRDHWPQQVEQGHRLIRTYRRALMRRKAATMLVETRGRLVPAPPQALPQRPDPVRERLAEQRRFVPEEPAVSPDPAITVTSWRLIKKLERPWFEATFGETLWAYVGSNYYTSLDTTRTQVLRGRMEATFGPPTYTMAEADAEAFAQLNEYIQFEYWFVVNDTIPLKVMDVNGPLERGLVVASDQAYRHVLRDLRDAFLQDVAQTEDVAPYVDYYYSPEASAWYRSGYADGRFFMNAIPRPDLWRGRPVLPAAYDR